MEAFRKVLIEAGVYSWLCGLFPEMPEEDLLRSVQDDFEGVLQKLNSLRGADSREAVAESG